MLFERGDRAEWLEWSGLPRLLNKVRAGGWTVFRKIAELDCRANQLPGTVEITLAELGERCGLEADAARKIVEALRQKKYLRIFLPENDQEAALLEIRVPILTPLEPAEAVRRAGDPTLRDPAACRYAVAPPERSAEETKIQAAVDLYFNFLSQKMNAFILEQIEIAARRFTLEEIRRTMERAGRHDLRTMGWVLKELIRGHAKKSISHP